MSGTQPKAMRLAALVALFAIVGSAGCASTGLPRVFDDRTVDEQRQDAERFDPYPEAETGPNNLGTRPREFDKGVAEPSRARWNPFTWTSRQRQQ